MAEIILKEWVLTIIKGAIEPKKFYWQDANRQGFNLTGKTATLRIKPAGANETALTSPVCTITDAVNGEITIAFTDNIINAYQFTEAEIALQIDSKIICKGTMKIRNWYEL